MLRAREAGTAGRGRRSGSARGSRRGGMQGRPDAAADLGGQLGRGPLVGVDGEDPVARGQRRARRCAGWRSRRRSGRAPGRPALGRSPRSGRGWRRSTTTIVSSAQAQRLEAAGRFSASSLARISAEIRGGRSGMAPGLPRRRRRWPGREIDGVGRQRQVEPAERGQDDPEVPADVGVAGQTGRAIGASPSGCGRLDAVDPVDASRAEPLLVPTRNRYFPIA